MGLHACWNHMALLTTPAAAGTQSGASGPCSSSSRCACVTAADARSERSEELKSETRSSAKLRR